jgi:glutamate--cysteine ligase
LSEKLKRNLSRLKQADGITSLANISHGLEKESLRIDPTGHLAYTPHPGGLGSALTHPCITTDFSEALMEFITPVYQNPEESLAFLSDVHTYTFTQLPREELLWTSSMPCILAGDDSIPLAQYGASNIGRLKTLYRKGLGFRYGRTMQTISGIHYNFSLPDKFWELYQAQLGDTSDLKDFKTEQYFGMIRNFRRFSWLPIYLFGASPALCKSFVRNNPNHGLEPFDDATLYLPYGTSLRMGDLGYTSKAQAGLYISYNNLAEYTDGLQKAIKTPYQPYIEFKTVDGSHPQLNANLLQIENEFYATIRPKRISSSGKRPVHALREEGVEYLEVRLLDLNPFLSLGIDVKEMNFLNCFLLCCLLRESPPSSPEEYRTIEANLKSVVRQGRDPALQIANIDNGGPVLMTDWASEILAETAEISQLLDSIHNNTAHTTAVQAQQAKVANPELTPSAKVLQRMRELKTSYARFALNQSLANGDYFRGLTLSDDKMAQFQRMSQTSNLEREAIEHSDTLDFETYLQNLNNS